MKLEQWLKLTGMKQKEFCALVGTSRPTINRHIKHGRVLDPELIIRIFFLTMGAVRPDDFYDLVNMPADVANLMTGPRAQELWKIYKKIPHVSDEAA